MTDTITLSRAVAEKLRKALFDWAECHNDVADFCDDDKEVLAALDAALAEPDVADLFARFAAKQQPLDADMAAILHANLDSLYITEDALQEGIDAQDRDLWQRRADEELLKEYEKRYGKPEPATVEQAREHFGRGTKEQWWEFRDGWKAAERFHGIVREDGK